MIEEWVFRRVFRKMSEKWRLAAFDFDHTIVDDNSDVVVRKLVPPGAITKQVESLHKSDGWTSYMQEIFNLLHRYKVSEEIISKTVSEIKPTPRMVELLEYLKNSNWEVIIISDANSYFIDCWLSRHQLRGAVSSIYTNPGCFDRGRLKIQKYHLQDWCKLSTKNLCKGHILQAHLQKRKEEGKEFEVVAYIGDGRNDYCPTLKLTEKDMVFPRVGFPLIEIIKSKADVKASVHPWSDASHILTILQTLD